MKIPKDSEAKLGVYVILDKGEKRKMGFQVLKMKMGNVHITEEEQDTHDRQVFASGEQG